MLLTKELLRRGYFGTKVARTSSITGCHEYARTYTVGSVGGLFKPLAINIADENTNNKEKTKTSWIIILFRRLLLLSVSVLTSV